MDDMTQTVVTCLLPSFELDRSTYGLLGAGDRYASQLGGRHVIVIAGSCDNDCVEGLRLRADAVWVASNDELAEYQPECCLAAAAALCGELEPTAVFLSDDTYSREITPRLAHRLGGSSTSDGQRVNWQDDRVCVTRPAYGGKAMAVARLNRLPAVVWLRARSFEPATPRRDPGQLERRTVELSSTLDQTQIVQRHEGTAQGTRLEDAKAIVSGGRGLGGPEPFTELKRLAQAMGAEVAASRAACDAGWVPPSWQVGQTGKKVAPQLYLAIAISGASQHLMGIADSKVIAAINTDAEAPIFRHCDFGLVEDYRSVVGPLTVRLAELLSE